MEQTRGNWFHWAQARSTSLFRPIYRSGVTPCVLEFGDQPIWLDVGLSSCLSCILVRIAGVSSCLSSQFIGQILCRQPECPVAGKNLCGYPVSTQRTGGRIQVQGTAMFAGQLSDISYRKSVDIFVWLQKEGKTVWILGEQQYLWERCPLFARSRPWFRLSSVGAQGAGTLSRGIWNTLFFAAAQENSWLGY